MEIILPKQQKDKNMKRGVKIYWLSSLYFLGAFIVACLLSFVHCEYKFAQLRNPEYVRKLIDIELPEFRYVDSEEDDNYPINHNSYSIWHRVEFAEPLSKTELEKIERVCSREEWPYGNRYGGWGLYFPESEYQYEYVDRNALRRLELYLSVDKAKIYYEVWDSYYYPFIGVLLSFFIIWITVMTVWGFVLLGLGIKRKINTRKQNTEIINK